ncbi:hypothetical protein B296_00014245 [Ensete ventricosum]|uniref:Uncharacterized protein n=1 Tax=Ensete ventricosum TaxID=4639 RepID=A0A426YWS7_ENSVE|nr:hypothetical protein B296_00014245 [Ensete ventricosum]
MKELAAAREGHSAVKQPAVAAGKKKPVEEHTAGTAERYAKQKHEQGKAVTLPWVKRPREKPAALTGNLSPPFPFRAY